MRSLSLVIGCALGASLVFGPHAAKADSQPPRVPQHQSAPTVAAVAPTASPAPAAKPAAPAIVPPIHLGQAAWEGGIANASAAAVLHPFLAPMAFWFGAAKSAQDAMLGKYHPGVAPHEDDKATRDSIKVVRGYVEQDRAEWAKAYVPSRSPELGWPSTLDAAKQSHMANSEVSFLGSREPWAVTNEGEALKLLGLRKDAPLLAASPIQSAPLPEKVLERAFDMAAKVAHDNGGWMSSADPTVAAGNTYALYDGKTGNLVGAVWDFMYFTPETAAPFTTRPMARVVIGADGEVRGGYEYRSFLDTFGKGTAKK